MYRIFILFLVSVNFLFAQLLPSELRLSTGSLSKTNDVLPESNNIEEIQVVKDTIWLATGNGLSRSTDNGETWTNYYGTEEFGTESVATVTYKKGVIYASAWHSEDVLGSSVPTGAGLRYSTDGGETWTSISQPLDDEADTLISYGINTLKTEAQVVENENYIRSIGVTSDAIWIASYAAGLRKSTDNGQTWQKVILPPDNLDSISPEDTLDFFAGPRRGTTGHANYIVTAIQVISDLILYVGTAGGINKTTDGGQSWIKFSHTNQQNPISGNAIWRIRYNKYDNSIWAATNKQNGDTEFYAVSRTDDGGQSWETFLPGGQIFDISFLPQTEGFDILVASDNGVYRSDNEGLTWIANPEIIDDVSNIKIVSRQFRSVAVTTETNSNIIWLGSKSDGLAKLEEEYGDFWSGSWKVYLSSDPLEDGIESKAFPNPFSPEITQLKIEYTTKGNSADVTLRIFDFDMNLVRTLLQSAPRDGYLDSYTEFWNGRDERGNIVPNGVYFYRIDLNSDEPEYGKIIVLR
ncbi:MAG: hypothetical protein PVH88_06685 [Ignavibacteria bacterium]|jgi:photosystem II stability/assembly factor-like uncharacterized protein